uniref:Lipoprotein n=1 Tax=viral metagenome TaxID=1070528 RepID=A0A6C0I492_9ZZZZ
MNKEYQLLFLFFIIIISLSLFISCSGKILPNSSGFTNHHSAYEGFSSMRPVDYSTAGNHAAIDTYPSFMLNNPNFECKKVYGFDGLYCQPYVADNKIDIYSGTEGSLTCTGTDLTNSKGFLCLNEKQRTLLTTRGGNA